jgi:hypothetical protein
MINGYEVKKATFLIPAYCTGKVPVLEKEGEIISCKG